MRINEKKLEDLTNKLKASHLPQEKDQLLMEIFLGEKHSVFIDDSEKEDLSYRRINLLFSDPDKKLKNPIALFLCSAKTLKEFSFDGTLRDDFAPYCHMEYADLIKGWWCSCLIPKNVRLQIEFYTKELSGNYKSVYRPPVLTMPNAEPQPWSELENEDKKGLIINSTKTRSTVEKGFIALSAFLSVAFAAKEKISYWQSMGIFLASVFTTYYVSHKTAPKYNFSVYLPRNYNPKRLQPYSLMVCLDGHGFLEKEFGCSRILDNLIAENKIPETVVVFLYSYHFEKARWKEYGCNDAFMSDLTQKILPSIRVQYNVSHDAKNTTIAGFSMGGLAATYAGLFYSQFFGNVISLSGSLWWHPNSPITPTSNDANLPDNFPKNWLIENCPKAKLGQSRFYLSAGFYEFKRAFSLLDSNKKMVEKLKNEGYVVTFQEFNGNHSPLDWRGSFADGLLWLQKPTLNLTRNQAAMFDMTTTSREEVAPTVDFSDLPFCSVLE